MQFTDTTAINNIKPPVPQQSADDDGSHFAAWHHPNGLTVIRVEGFGENVDGETLLSWHPASGVEIGPSTVFAEAGEARITLFAGSYEEQKACFFKWGRMARKNTRPRTFFKGGVEALAALGPTSPPPFPPIDAELTRRANKAVREARKHVAEAIRAGEELTLDRCRQLAEQVDKGMATRRRSKRR